VRYSLHQLHNTGNISFVHYNFFGEKQELQKRRKKKEKAAPAVVSSQEPPGFKVPSSGGQKRRC